MNSRANQLQMQKIALFCFLLWFIWYGVKTKKAFDQCLVRRVKC